MTQHERRALEAGYDLLSDAIPQPGGFIAGVKPPRPVCPWCDREVHGPGRKLGPDIFHTACWREFGATLGAAGVEEVPGT